MKHLFLYCIFFAQGSSLVGINLTFSAKPLEKNILEMTIHATLDPQEYIYKEFMTFSVDDPNIQLSPWKSSLPAKKKYDPIFKATKKIYDEPVDFTLQAVISPTIFAEDNAHLHVSFYRNKSQSPEEIIFPFRFRGPTTRAITLAPNSSEKKAAPLLVMSSTKPQENEISFSFSAYLSTLVEKTESTGIRILLVFLLGILLSLTPCIYPMVPITAGILQAQGSKSFFYNFLLSCSYTIGMAMTFALFGLLASCTGPICGQLLMEPLFILGLVIILAYLALSLFGFYDIYVPKFFRPSAKTLKTGSLFSTFLFGAASGTIASPCVSPGLALLLSIVATLGNKLLGFLLLFAFGIGLSMPLLIVGTFSSSINLLPRTGLWMVEIKKLFGFIMLGMCFYYLNYIIPPTILLWVLALFIALSGIYYIYHGEKLHSKRWQTISRVLGIVILSSSFIVLYYAAKQLYAPHEMQDDAWHTDYTIAREEAIKTGKKLFIDFWATFCPVCLAINKTVLTKKSILNVLQRHFVIIKVNGSHANNYPYAELKKKFPIPGFPTFLIVDPTTETIIAQFGGELYEMKEAEIIQAFEKYQ